MRISKDRPGELLGKFSVPYRLRESLEITLIIVFILLTYNFLFTSVEVSSYHMLPTLHAHQRVLVSRLPYQLTVPRRGDVVALADGEMMYLCRVVGLPYERITIRDRQVFVNGRYLDEPYLPNLHWRLLPDGVNSIEYRVAPRSYLLLGDNRGLDRDDCLARGLVSQEEIVGRAWLIYWPLEDLAFVRHGSASR